jgi:hypothetical protein
MNVYDLVKAHPRLSMSTIPISCGFFYAETDVIRQPDKVTALLLQGFYMGCKI